MGHVQDAVNRIEGWLAAEAIHLTIELFNFQKTLGITGPILELGVFRGKYLSLLYGLSSGTRDLVVGVDAFLEKTGVPLCAEHRDYAIGVIRSNVASVDANTDRLVIVPANTLDLGPADIYGFAGAPYRFISVDAGHDAESVFHDVSIMMGSLAEGCILALDDVYNCRCPGVAEGVCRFMATSVAADLRPFAVGGNKLFVTTKGSWEKYFSFCRQLVAEGNDPCLQGAKEIMREYEFNNFKPAVFSSEVILV